MGAVFLVAWTTICGSILTYAYDRRATIGARLCAGGVIGSILQGFAGYTAAATVHRMTADGQWAAAFVSGLPALLLLRAPVRTAFARDIVAALQPRLPIRTRRILYGTGVVLTAALLVYLLRGAMYVENGSIYTDNHHNLGDLPFHVAVIQDFLHGHNLPPQHPEFAGIRLTYPFLGDFMTAQYELAGATLVHAMLLQSVVLAAALVGLFYRWVFLLTRSTVATVVAPLLVLFSGGAGFIKLYTDGPGQGWMYTLTHLPRDYTLNNDDMLRWGNSLTTLLTTQRGLMIAFPVALMVWTLWWQDRQSRRDGWSLRRLTAAGILTGALPLFHGHTYLMLLLVGAGLAVDDLWRALRRGDGSLRGRVIGWAVYFALALALAAPQAYVLAPSRDVNSAHFMGLQVGWDHGDMALLPFYLWNLGLFIPLVFAALLWRWQGRKVLSRRLVGYYLPFVTCFVVANTVRLAPWIWDNMKMLFFWHIASSILIAALLAHFWRWGRVPGRVAVVALFFVLTFAGVLDVARIAAGTLRQVIYDRETIAFAHAIDAATPPGAVVLAYPIYNSPVTLAGRLSLYGYEGHLWSHGLNFAARKLDVTRMYAGAPDAKELLAKYHVGYVIMGPLEHTDPVSAKIFGNEAFYRQYPVAARVGPYTLYRVGAE